MTTIEIIMMIAFVLTMIFSGWKLYAFMPTKALQDDDTTPDSKEDLKKIMYAVIREGEVQEETLLDKMKEVWSFLAGYFQENSRGLKKIQSAKNLELYKAAVKAFFSLP